MDSGNKRAFYLGRYNCIERLGEGPLGETWRAKVYGVAGFEKQFAVKRLHQQLCEDEGFVSGFVKAASAYAALDHERIARVHEVNVQGAQYYVASDLIRGVDLARMMEALAQRGEALSPDAAMLIALDVADALGHAHARRDLLPGGVLHLGFTPRSVMVTHEGEVRLLDVGLIAPLVRPGWADAPPLERTAPYLAPEVLRGDGHDARADVFSLGIVLHELIAGRAPFTGKNTSELLAQMKTLPSAPPCDSRLQAVLGQSLQANPEFRLQSMSAWREQLVPILASRANRARTDLAAVVRRVARPERKTGAFPVVAIPAMPPPPPPTMVTPQKSWAPPSEPGVRKTPVVPRGPQLSSSPTHNTLSGMSTDDAAVLPLELVELPGTPTLPTMDAVKAPRPQLHEPNEDEPTRPVERVDLEAPTAKVQKAEAAPTPSNGAGLYGESGDTATTENPFARTLPGEPIPADPKRFPSLAAEDAREAAEVDSRARTLPSSPSISAVDSATAGFVEAAHALAATSSAREEVAAKEAGAASPPEIGGAHVEGASDPSTLLTTRGADPAKDAGAAGVGGNAPASSREAATRGEAAKTVRHGASAAPSSSAAFVPPPLGLPPVPEARPWLFLVGVAVLVAASVAGAVYFVYWKQGTPTTVGEQEVPSANPAPGASGALAIDPAGSPPTVPTTGPTGSSPGAPAAVPGGQPATPATAPTATPPVAPSGSTRSGAPSGGVAAGLTGTVDVATTPDGASIYVDGELQQGVAPMHLQLARGSHRVVALLEGRRMRRESVKVGEGLTQINLTLDPVALPAEVAGPAGLKVRCAKTHGELRILVDGQDTGRQCPNEERISVKGGTHRIGLFSPHTDQTVEVEKDVADDGDHSTRIYLKY